MPSTSHPGRRALECARRSAAVARSSWRSARLSEQRKPSLPRPAYLRRPCGPASVRLHPPRVVPGPGARTAAGDGCPAQTQTHTTHSTPPTNAVRPQAWSSPNPNAREAPVSFPPPPPPVGQAVESERALPVLAEAILDAGRVGTLECRSRMRLGEGLRCWDQANLRSVLMRAGWDRGRGVWGRVCTSSF